MNVGKTTIRNNEIRNNAPVPGDRTFEAKNGTRNVSKDAPFKACGAVLTSQLEAQISGVQVGDLWTKEL